MSADNLAEILHKSDLPIQIYVGAGQGSEMIRAYEQTPDSVYVGIDTDAEAVHYGRQQLPPNANIHLVEESIFNAQSKLYDLLEQHSHKIQTVHFYFPEPIVLSSLTMGGQIYETLDRLCSSDTEVVVVTEKSTAKYVGKDNPDYETKIYEMEAQELLDLGTDMTETMQRDIQAGRISMQDVENFRTYRASMRRVTAER